MPLDSSPTCLRAPVNAGELMIDRLRPTTLSGEIGNPRSSSSNDETASNSLPGSDCPGLKVLPQPSAIWCDGYSFASGDLTSVGAAVWRHQEVLRFRRMEVHVLVV